MYVLQLLDPRITLNTYDHNNNNIKNVLRIQQEWVMNLSSYPFLLRKRGSKYR